MDRKVKIQEVEAHIHGMSKDDFKETILDQLFGNPHLSSLMVGHRLGDREQEALADSFRFVGLPVSDRPDLTELQQIATAIHKRAMQIR